MATDETNQPRGERLRILISFARPHQRALLLGLALSLVATAMALATPMVTKWVLDSLSGGVSLAGPIALLLGLLVVGSVVGLAQWILLGTVAERIVLDARQSLLVRHFLRATVPAVASADRSVSWSRAPPPTRSCCGRRPRRAWSAWSTASWPSSARSC